MCGRRSVRARDVEVGEREEEAAEKEKGKVTGLGVGV